MATETTHDRFTHETVSYDKKLRAKTEAKQINAKKNQHKFDTAAKRILDANLANSKKPQTTANTDYSKM